jgi:hypothetical protein
MHVPVPTAHCPSVPHEAAPWSLHGPEQQMPLVPHGPPLAHSSPVPHAAPFAILETHSFPLQYAPAAHWASLEQLVPHAAPLHAYSPHETGVPGLHVPAPSHAGAACIPFEHDPAPQDVVAGQSAHPPPLHLPSVPHVEAAVATQMPRGSTVPSIALAHVPLAPPVRAAVHASHALVHAASQQNPSTQNPLVHWSTAVHGTPAPCLAWHTPAAQ